MYVFVCVCGRRQTTDDKTVCICQRQNQKETFKNESPPATAARRASVAVCIVPEVHCAAVGPRQGAGQQGGKGMVMVEGVVVLVVDVPSG